LIDAPTEHAQRRSILPVYQLLPGREHGRFSIAIHRVRITGRLPEHPAGHVERA
jgi:hypothetical protein